MTKFETLLRWEFFRDGGTWESFSSQRDHNGRLRWIITVLHDGKFDLSSSDEELVNGVHTFETLATAKAFCESSEATSLAFDASRTASTLKQYEMTDDERRQEAEMERAMLG